VAMRAIGAVIPPEAYEDDEDVDADDERDRDALDGEPRADGEDDAAPRTKAPDIALGAESADGDRR